MSIETCGLSWCSNPKRTRGLCSTHYVMATRDYDNGSRGSVTVEARGVLLPSQNDDGALTCQCVAPLDVSPIDECQRCYRPVAELIRARRRAARATT